jgi:hypothetical protein
MAEVYEIANGYGRKNVDAVRLSVKDLDQHMDAYPGSFGSSLLGYDKGVRF